MIINSNKAYYMILQRDHSLCNLKYTTGLTSASECTH